MNNKQIITTRFAPSPSGNLHIGNARIALINWLFAKKHNGRFILRIDDTNRIKSKEIYIQNIHQDLKWLGIGFDTIFYQSERKEKYLPIIQDLIKKKKLYKCYETPEELQRKRDKALKEKKPPIYDRSSLYLSDIQEKKLLSEGRVPYFRFLLDKSTSEWQDLVKGNITYNTKNVSDPIVIKPDGTITYLLCSTLDDIDYQISHILRGEDHLTNTAIQIQMMKSLGVRELPKFGHLNLVKSENSKISKSKGGFDLGSLRDKLDLDPLSIINFLVFAGTNKSHNFYKNLESILSEFSLKNYSTKPLIYEENFLIKLNQKLLSSFTYTEIQEKLSERKISINISKEFWNLIKNNLENIEEISKWSRILESFTVIKIEKQLSKQEQNILKTAIKNLPNISSEQSWQDWIQKVSTLSNTSMKNVFYIIRLSITGNFSGPELKKFLCLLSIEEIKRRFDKFLSINT